MSWRRRPLSGEEVQEPEFRHPATESEMTRRRTMVVPRSGAGPGFVLVEGVEAGHEMGAVEGSLWHGSQVPKSSSQRPLRPHQPGPRLLLRPRLPRLLLQPGRLQPRPRPLPHPRSQVSVRVLRGSALGSGLHNLLLGPARPQPRPASMDPTNPLISASRTRPCPAPPGPCPARPRPCRPARAVPRTPVSFPAPTSTLRTDPRHSLSRTRSLSRI